MVGSEPEFRAGGQHSGQLIKGFLGDESPLLMPFLGPWVGKKQKGPFDSITRQGHQKSPPIIRENSNIPNKSILPARLLHGRQQFGNAIDVGFAADETRPWPLPSLIQQMTAVSESYFQPNPMPGLRGLRAEHVCQIQLICRRRTARRG
jgi:hypothetical protein